MIIPKSSLVFLFIVLLVLPLSTLKAQKTDVGSLYSIYLNHDDLCMFGRIDIINKITGKHIHNYTQITSNNSNQFTMDVTSLNTVKNCSSIKGLFARTSAYSDEQSAFYWSPGYHEGGTYTISLSGSPPHERSKVSSPYDAGGVWAMAYDKNNNVVYQLDSNRLLSVKPLLQQSKVIAKWNNTALKLDPSPTEAVFDGDKFYFIHSNRKDLIAVDVSSNKTNQIKCSTEMLDIQHNAVNNILYSINKGDGCIDIQKFTNIESCKFDSVTKIQDNSALVTTDQQGDMMLVATYDYLHIIDLTSRSVASVSGSVTQFLASFQFAPMK